jgi:hypothetical protein
MAVTRKSSSAHPHALAEVSESRSMSLFIVRSSITPATRPASSSASPKRRVTIVFGV